MQESQEPIGAKAVPHALNVENVSVHFAGLVALDKVDLAVPHGSAVGLIGPNGAGKTTLFNVVSGFQRASSGTITIGGTPIAAAASPHARARAGLARTFQRLELFDELTVAEHLMLSYRAARRVRRRGEDGRVSKTGELVSARIASVLEDLGLSDDTHRLVTNLPLGVGRLVEVARALISSPKVLLLDEPSSGLNDIETDRLLRSLRSINKGGGGPAILLVEHNLDFVMSICSAVNVLNFGQILACGAPDEIRTHSGVQEAYLGVKEVGS